MEKLKKTEDRGISHVESDIALCFDYSFLGVSWIIKC